jgi:hypothetical protein
MIEKALHKLLADSATIKLGTASGRGEPWVATAYFVDAAPFSLQVMIESTGRTLRNIRENPVVALMIENGDAMALFGQASAAARPIDDQKETVREAISKKTPGSAPLVGLPNLVAVQLEVHSWRLTHVAAGWIPGKELPRP